MARSKSLSKSSYCSGVQCHKMLWLKEHRPAAFAAMDKMSPEEMSACRANLLKYCGLDTFAMVKVLEKLQEKAEL